MVVTCLYDLVLRNVHMVTDLVNPEFKNDIVMYMFRVSNWKAFDFFWKKKLKSWANKDKNESTI